MWCVKASGCECDGCMRCCEPDRQDDERDGGDYADFLYEEMRDGE